MLVNLGPDKTQSETIRTITELQNYDEVDFDGLD